MGALHLATCIVSILGMFNFCERHQSNEKGAIFTALCFLLAIALSLICLIIDYTPTKG